MRLKKLKIKGFKNLTGKDGWFEMDFEDKNGITVLIGNNGSGKSNVLEAISAIFAGLYNGNSTKFDYELKYEMNYSGTTLPMTLPARLSHKKIIKIISSSDQLHVEIPGNKNEPKPKGFIKDQIRSSLPSQVIAAYSGEETRLYEEYYLPFYDDFISDIIHNKKTISDNSPMTFIHKDHWAIALLTMAASDVDMSEILGDIKIEKVNIIFNSENIGRLKKGRSNQVIDFANDLLKEKKINLEKFKSVAIDTHKDLYKKLSVAMLPKDKKNKIIESIDLIFDNGVSASCLSEGEKKQILIYFILNLLADKDSLILFDEPDSYIHVGNKERLKIFFEKYLEDHKREGEILFTTHSPTLMHHFDDVHLQYLENGEIVSNEKAKILEKIAGNVMSYAEQQIILNTDDDILLVEGKTDELFIKEALSKINDDKYKKLKDSKFIPTGGASGLRIFIDRFTAKENQNIIAILDYDMAGKDEITEILTTDDQKILSKKGYVKIEKLKNTFLLKLPKLDRITDSQYEIEDYFPLARLTDISKAQIDTFKVLKNFVLKKDMVKRKLAEACKNFEPSDFEGFRSLFNLIIEIKKSA